MDLRIDYQLTRDTGNQVTSQGNDFQDLLNTIKNVNSELQTYWEGSDATKYSTAVAEQAEEMQKLANTINEIGEFLVSVGNAYEKAAEENSNSIR